MTIEEQKYAENRPQRRVSRGARRHEQAVIQAEARSLARALRPYRVMGRDALERSVSRGEGLVPDMAHSDVRS